MAYVYKRGSVYWIGYTDSAGNKCQEPTKATSKAEARDLAHELARKSYRIKKGLEAEVGADSVFEKRALQWLAQLPKEYRSKDTAERYLRQRILPFLGKKTCRAITREDVRAMLRANESPRTSVTSGESPRAIVLRAAEPGTREKLRAYVHTIFEWLIDDLEVVNGRNPAAGKRMRIKSPKRLPRFIPPRELVRLLEEIPPHYRLLFSFAVVTGVRKGELIPLEWPDLRLEERHAAISKSRGNDTTKGSADRLVPLPKWLVAVLESERRNATSKYVFPNEKGGRHRFDVKLTRVMRTAAKRAGLVTGYRHSCRRSTCERLGVRVELPDGTPRPCAVCGYMSWAEPIPKQYKFKDLRSTFGTLAASQTGDIRFVQQVLGHASVTTTEGHYARAITNHLVEKADRVDMGLGPVSDLSVTPKEVDGFRVAASESEALKTQSE